MSYRKLYIVLLIMLFVVGCGTISSEAVNTNPDSSNTGIENPPTDPINSSDQDYHNFISAMSSVYGMQLKSYSSQEAAAVSGLFSIFSLPAGLGDFQLAESFNTQAINYDNSYLYWYVSSNAKTMGDVMETYEQKWRYWDLRTGLPFSHYLSNQTDIDNIAFIERLEIITGKYSAYPADPVYVATYHEKIVKSGINYIIFIFPGGLTNTILYHNWAPGAPFSVTSLNITYDIATKKNGLGYINVVSSTGTFRVPMNFTIVNSVTTGSGYSYAGSDSLPSHKLTMPGPSGKIETQYYIGALYHYTSITSTICSDLEDYAAIEYQDSDSYGNTIVIDGATAACKFGARLTNLKLSSKTGLSQYPKQTKLCSINHTDGVIVERIDFSKKGLRIIDCNNVTINGRYYSYISNQTFYN